MEFPRQEHWSDLPFPSPGDLPDPGIEPISPAVAGAFFITELPYHFMSSLWQTLLRFFCFRFMGGIVCLIFFS